MSPDTKITQIQENVKALLAQHQADVLLLNTVDALLSEYNPAENNFCRALSGFSGSTAQLLILGKSLQEKLQLKNAVILFVDGRYHIQAEQECREAPVELFKVPFNGDFQQSPITWLRELPADLLVGRTLSICGQRTTWNLLKSLKEFCNEKNMHCQVLNENDILTASNLPGLTILKPIREVPFSVSGRSLAANVAALQSAFEPDVPPTSTCFLTCAADDAAWLLNARGFHGQHAAGVFAYTFTIGNELIVYLPSCTKNCPLELSPSSVNIHLIRNDEKALYDYLKRFAIDKVLFDGATTNAWLPTLASQIWPQANTVENFNALTLLREQKTQEEQAAIADSFLRASRAIAKTLREVKQSVYQDCSRLPEPKSPQKPAISEWDLAERILRAFREEGAVDLSFHTIASTGPNAAIVHYSGASPEIPLKAGELVLLDCGAYFSAGFATDTTRTIFCGSEATKPQPWQTQIYTVALKAMLAGFLQTLPPAITGKEIDEKIRSTCQQYGYNYAHGTGHGIGINVHEAGGRISPKYEKPLKIGLVTSIEPGIYLEGKGGVRHENAAILQPDPNHSGENSFQNLTWVGFDWDVIELNLLSEPEKEWLTDYERRCLALGTEISKCPLLD